MTADAAVPATVVLGTPLGAWSRDVLSSLARLMPAIAQASDEGLARWLDETVGDADALALDAGAWSLDAQRLERDMPVGLLSSSAPAWAADPRGCWALPALLRHHGSARYLALVESPVDSLATWMESEADVDAEAFLDRWCDGASKLLALLELPRDQRSFVDVGQARRHPVALAAWVQRFAGFGTVSESELPPAGSASPLALGVARSLVDEHPRCLDLFLELLAACEMLVQEPAELAGSVSAMQAGRPASEVVQAYRRVSADARSHVHSASLLERLQADALANERALLEERSRADAQAAALGQAQTELEAARRDNELLQAQVRQVVDELVFYHAERSAAPPVPAPSVPVVPLQPAAPGASYAGALTFGEPRDTPPHRELPFDAQGLQAFDRQVESLRGRLVEHHGRAGLVVFGDAGHEPLAGWTESGVEDGCAFMLLVPSDVHAADMAARLSTTDWVLLCGLARQLVAEVPRHGLSAVWSAAATRLLHELLSLPMAFRFDRFEATKYSDGAAQLHFQRAMAGPLDLGDVQLRWSPGHGGRADRLAMVRPAGEWTCPWGSWPVERDGRFAIEWVLPVGDAGTEDAKRQAWVGQSSTDQAALVALLDSAGRQAAPGVLPPEFAQRLSILAAEAQRLRAAPRWRRVARALRHAFS